jgi:serine acetyltransferase
MWAMVGAGAIVISDVLDHSLVVGVPGKQIGWVGKLGIKLKSKSNGLWECPVSKDVYNFGGLIK